MRMKNIKSLSIILKSGTIQLKIIFGVGQLSFFQKTTQTLPPELQSI